MDDFDQKMDGINQGESYVHEGFTETEAYDRNYGAAENLIFKETPYA